jgi:hypothetical protein
VFGRRGGLAAVPQLLPGVYNAECRQLDLESDLKFRLSSESTSTPDIEQGNAAQN